MCSSRASTLFLCNEMEQQYEKYFVWGVHTYLSVLFWDKGNPNLTQGWNCWVRGVRGLRGGGHLPGSRVSDRGASPPADTRHVHWQLLTSCNTPFSSIRFYFPLAFLFFSLCPVFVALFPLVMTKGSWSAAECLSASDNYRPLDRKIQPRLLNC